MIELNSNDLQVTNDIPPVILALSNDDTAVPPINGFNYYQECNNYGVPASIHYIQQGVMDGDIGLLLIII